MDDSCAYAAALALNPQFRFGYFDDKWKGTLKEYVPKVKRAILSSYSREYKDKHTVEAEEEDNNPEDFLASYIGRITPKVSTNEFQAYMKSDRTVLSDGNLFRWWDSQNQRPGLRQMAFDHLSIPAMSSEVERGSLGAGRAVATPWDSILIWRQ